MSNTVAGRNSSNGNLDSFKQRANKTRESLTQIFGPSIKSGDSNVFSQARVYEYQARREGFANYASLKAASQTNGTTNSNRWDKDPRIIGLMKQLYPDFFFASDCLNQQHSNEVRDDYDFQLQLQKFSEMLSVDPKGNLVAIYSSGTDFGFLSFENLTVDDIESEEVELFCSCRNPQFEAAVQICPVPEEWSGKPFSEYIAANIPAWKKELTEKVESKITSVLLEMLDVVDAYKEKFSDRMTELSENILNDEFVVSSTQVVLLPYIPDFAPFHIVGHVGKYLVVAFEPSILPDGEDDLADFVIRFGIIDVHSFQAGLALKQKDGVSCCFDWFSIDSSYYDENSVELIQVCNKSGLEKGRIPIRIQKSKNHVGYTGGIDIIYDASVTLSIENWIEENIRYIRF